MTSYTAPAAKLLTVLHIAGEDGRTLCGITMDPAGLWMPVELRPGDRVHEGCEKPQLFAEEQGALL